MGVAEETSTAVPAVEGPQRTCAVSREERPAGDLLRFALSPDGDIVPDLAGRLPGRGVWITLSQATVAQAVKTRAFSRSLKREVKADPELADVVARLLVRRVIDRLAIANKAGLVVSGTSKVDAAIASGLPVALIHGADAAPDGVEKLDRRYLAMCRDADQVANIVRDLEIDQMSLALGRLNVVHAALMMGGAADLFLSEAHRLRRYKTG